MIAITFIGTRGIRTRFFDSMQPHVTTILTCSPRMCKVFANVVLCMQAIPLLCVLWVNGAIFACKPF